MPQYLVLTAAAVSVVACVSYIRAMFRGQARPNRVSWLMWAIAPLIATAAAVSDGVTWAAVPVFMSGFIPAVVFGFSFATKTAYWKSAPFDYACGACSALALVLWAITKDPNVAIVFAIASDALAGVPTVIKSWRHPESESSGPYLAGLFGPVAGLAAVRTWTFSSYAFPIHLLVINSAILLGIYRRKWKPARPGSGSATM